MDFPQNLHYKAKIVHTFQRIAKLVITGFRIGGAPLENRETGLFYTHNDSLN